MKYDFDPEIAKKVGVEESIMYSNIVWWCQKNQANNKHFYDGRFRTYNKIEAFCELFPFWTEKQIIRILNNLKKAKLIVSGNRCNNKHDRTLWYSNCVFLDIGPNGQMEMTKWANGNDQMGKGYIRKTDNKPNNKPDITLGKIKHLDNVYLLESEYEGLMSMYGKQIVDDNIIYLNNYIANNPDKGIDGKKAYKSHHATLRNWIKKAGHKEKKQEIKIEKVEIKQYDDLPY